MGLPVPIIADHLGGMLGTSKIPSESDQAAPLNQLGFKALLALAKTSHVNIKITGLYRASNETATTYSDLQPIIEEFAHEILDRVIWGSDWPHTGGGAERVGNKPDMSIKRPFRKTGDMGILEQLQWRLGSEDVWLKVLRENPGRLYE
ncbi:hypothetical protein DPV78_008597 [Talaromyces pinophilus]|nr:hypothetical protein DPV78_008597 [Talaromyces pinophilus]